MTGIMGKIIAGASLFLWLVVTLMVASGCSFSMSATSGHLASRYKTTDHKRSLWSRLSEREYGTNKDGSKGESFMEDYKVTAPYDYNYEAK